MAKGDVSCQQQKSGSSDAPSKVRGEQSEDPVVRHERLGPPPADEPAVATPRPPRGVSAEAGAHWIQRDVPNQLVEMPVTLNQAGIEAFLERCPWSPWRALKLCA
jgi:hypothetical protein